MMIPSRLLLLPFLLWALFDSAVCNDEDSFMFADRTRLVVILTAALMTNFPIQFGFQSAYSHSRTAGFAKRGSPGQPRQRSRRSVNSIFAEQGPYYVRRAYRMDEPSFWQLHRILRPCIVNERNQRSTKKHKDGAPNGIITSSIRLSAALRYFAGGSAHDIALVHGISHAEVFYSVWRIVNAVNACPELSFKFPTAWEEQRAVAQGFYKKSKAGFKGCVGAIDGMLVWIEKPTEQECRNSGCGAAKFMCGRKGKFGVNLQGVCDSKKRFLDVSICHPGSTSDYLTFITSPLYFKLEQKDFLAPELHLFGDCAYVNTSYMATPYKAVKSGPKDAYNYYHSNLRIHIECAFGELVQRFAILRRALPQSMGLKKTTALVMCLCRLHNCCIDRRQGTIPPALMKDRFEADSRGGIPVVATEENNNSPEQLLHGGEHFDDVTTGHKQQMVRDAKTALGFDVKPPREKMLDAVEFKRLERPVPAAWK